MHYMRFLCIIASKKQQVKHLHPSLHRMICSGKADFLLSFHSIPSTGADNYAVLYNRPLSMHNQSLKKRKRNGPMYFINHMTYVQRCFPRLMTSFLHNAFVPNEHIHGTFPVFSIYIYRINQIHLPHKSYACTFSDPSDGFRCLSESFGKHMPIHPYHGFMKMIVPLCFRERLCPASAIICPDKSPASGVRFCSLFLHAGSAYLYHELY